MKHRNWITGTLLLAACGRDVVAPSAPTPGERSDGRIARAAVGAVYTLSNATTGNAVLAFPRYADGSLGAATAYPTTGLGTGGGLGSQDAVIVNQNATRLFAVDAGSNQVTSFRVTQDGLSRVATISSGGLRPISVTLHENRLYVLNAGGAGNITGFHVADDGALHPLAGSTRSLSGSAVGPAQVSFTPDGHLLVVTEKGTNNIVTYVMSATGTPGAPVVNASAGQTPFGFAFDKRGTLIVSEAFGGGPNASAASSYQISATGVLTVISASVPTSQTAACWFVVSTNGKFAYTTNTGSGSVSGYSIKDGTLVLLDADGRTGVAGAAPTDEAMSHNSQFLYTLNSRGNSISAFQVSNGSGALSSLTTTSGVPSGSVGLAAY